MRARFNKGIGLPFIQLRTYNWHWVFTFITMCFLLQSLSTTTTTFLSRITITVTKSTSVCTWFLSACVCNKEDVEKYYKPITWGSFFKAKICQNISVLTTWKINATGKMPAFKINKIQTKSALYAWMIKTKIASINSFTREITGHGKTAKRAGKP